MINSLRSRLFLGLTVIVVLGALAASGLVFQWSFEEAIEPQDAILRQVGAVADRAHLRSSVDVPVGVEAEDQVLIEEPGKLSGAAEKLRLPVLDGDLPDGLQTITRDKIRWRVFVLTRSDGSRMAVSQRSSYRNEIAHGAAVQALLPNAALIPCVLFLVAMVIAYSFRPLSALAAQVKARTTDYLAPLPLKDMRMSCVPSFIRSICF